MSDHLEMDQHSTAATDVKKTFRVWNADRTQKKSIFCVCDIDVVKRKASEKLATKGSQLVLEEDGTEIDDDEVLHDLASDGKVFQLLASSEKWRRHEGDDGSSHAEPLAGCASEQQLSHIEKIKELEASIDRKKLELKMLELHDRQDERKTSKWMIAGGVGLMIAGGAAAAAAAPVVLAGGLVALTVEAAALAGGGVVAALSGAGITVGVARNSKEES